jgi:hypothetical protein
MAFSAGTLAAPQHQRNISVQAAMDLTQQQFPAVPCVPLALTALYEQRMFA